MCILYIVILPILIYNLSWNLYVYGGGILIVKTVDLIGVQMDFGAGTRGVSMGPLAIRYNDLVENIKKLGIYYIQPQDIILKPSLFKNNNK